LGENLTVEIAYKALQNFMQQKPFILFGSGTSCAVDSRFGMTALKDYLISAIPIQLINPTELSQWNAVAYSLANGIDLESAMNAIQDEGLTQKIVDSTADFVASLDLEYSVKILSGQTVWPAILLFKHIVEGLPMSDWALHVATTNYDLLAEYALEKAKIPYITGYCGGINVSVKIADTYPTIMTWSSILFIRHFAIFGQCI
jgi:hypothetical protein